MANDRLKIIVGVDYGTTFTGVSYVTSDRTGADIVVLRSWPGPGRPVEGNWKTPTTIAYGSENSRNKDCWGYEVLPSMTSCSWTKLLLDTSAETAEYDDPSLREATGSSFFRLPPCKDAQRVCQDFLKEVYNFIVDRLRLQMTQEIFNVTPMECYLTMPAIWTDKAQTATREAAKAAGFGSRPFDSIKMITEPEAAAIATLKKDLRPDSVNSVKPGDNILVLDCGGGTVDITTYTIQKTYPRIEFDEICVGAGGKCGSTYIDRNFHKLMLKRFGPAFQNAPAKQKAPSSNFMISFEKAKQSFGSSENDSFDILPIKMRDVENPDYYDKDESTVKLSRKDMEELFEPVVKDILRLVSQQVSYALSSKGKRINLIVLVGGFGNSDYVKKALDNWCLGNGGIKSIRPDFCQAAVVRGAAIRGLEGTMPSKLICRRHYGFTWGLPFRPGIDDERHAYQGFDLGFGSKYCAGHMNWIIGKGYEVTTSTYKTVRVTRPWSPGQSYVFQDALYSCNLDSAPNRLEHPRILKIGDIRIDFTSVDMSKFQWRNTSNGIEYNLEYEIRIDFTSQEGVLMYSCISSGKTIGVTTIDFSD